MKRLFNLCAFLVFCLTGSAFASQMDYITNNGVEYLKNPAGRQAATDSADVAANNPAGTIKMKDGLYVNLSNQTILKTYSFEDKANDGEFESFKVDPLLPNLYLVFNPEGQNWNLWSHCGVLGGGGSLIFSEGGPVGNQMLYAAMALADGQALSAYKAGYDAAVAAGNLTLAGQYATTATPFSALTLKYMTDNSLGTAAQQQAALFNAMQKYSFEVEQSSVQLCQSFGSTYSVTNDLSVALGVRVVESTKKNIIRWATGAGPKTTLVDVELSALGFGGILGVNWQVTPDLNIALTYESVTKLEYEVDSKKNGTTPVGLLSKGLTDGLGFEDGKKYNYDMPHRFLFGAKYNMTKDFALSFSAMFYVRDFGVDMERGTNNSDMIHAKKWSYEVGAGFDWQITDRINWGAGCTYDEMNTDEDYFTESTFKPSLFISGTGFTLKMNERVNVNLGVSKLFFFDTENKKEKAYAGATYAAAGAQKDLKFKKENSWSIGIGMQYRFM